MKYTFEIPGRPRAKQSMRAVRTTTGIRSYQPTDVTNYHGKIAAFARQAIPAPLEGPIRLSLQVVILTPKSWSKKRKAMLNYATTRPDLDNVCKSLMDGLNGVAWHDDRQVVELYVEKRYGSRDAVVVTVEASQ